MPIVIDEPFIRDIIGKLKTQRDAIDRAKTGNGNYADQTLADLFVTAGTDAFEPGLTLRQTVDAIGNALGARMDQYYSTLDGLVDGLEALLANSDYVESLNTYEGSRLADYLPSSSSAGTGMGTAGGSGAGAPDTAGSTSTSTSTST